MELYPTTQTGDTSLRDTGQIRKSDILIGCMEWGGISPLEFYAAMTGALKAMGAVARGDLDAAVWLEALDEWDRTMVDGSARFGTSDWPGWADIGLIKVRQEPKEPKPQRQGLPKQKLADVLMAPMPPSGQWVVYRHYDSAGYLLYVGKSSNFKGRHSQHKAGALWWNDIVRITVQPVRNAEEAQALELEAIALEDPEWNVSNRP